MNLSSCFSFCEAIRRSRRSNLIAKMVDKWIGKVAVVTGASSGMGAAIFKSLSQSGVNVIGLARRVERVETAIKLNELGTRTKGKVYAYKCDISDPKSVTEAFKWIEKEFKVVNILVNNAGIGRNSLILGETEQAFTDFNDILNTNVRGLVQCTREAYRLMKKSDDYGLIININSILGHQVINMGIPGNSYTASKFAVTAITETLRQELNMVNNTKVRVTVSFISTDMSKKYFLIT